jgi:Flp pilus assembly protein TadD
LAGKVIITTDASRQAAAVAAEATKLMTVGEFGRAEALWLKALQLDPNSVAAWLGLGRNCSEDDKNAEAVRATRVAVQLKPNDHATHHALALALFLDGKREEAVKETGRAKELGDPDWELLTAMIEAEVD